jgi:AcrR family transcriptional regulator
MSASPFPLPDLHRLHSGRHRLTPEAVVESQRGRMLLAVAQVVAEKGYTAATVADVVERAGVSRRTFYDQFADKEACFLAAFDFGVSVVIEQMVAAAKELPDGDWRARTRSDWETYLEVLAAEPAFAWALHVEVLGAGRAALEHRARILGLFTDRTRRAYEIARKQDRKLPKLPDVIFRMHTGGMDELVRECLRSRGPEGLPELIEPGLRATFTLFGVQPPK